MHITILYWMGLHTQMFLFALLNADSNRTMWVQCITIRFWLQTEDLISFSKQVEMGINMNQHGQNIKSKGFHLCRSHSFEQFPKQTLLQFSTMQQFDIIFQWKLMQVVADWIESQPRVVLLHWSHILKLKECTIFPKLTPKRCSKNLTPIT